MEVNSTMGARSDLFKYFALNIKLDVGLRKLLNGIVWKQHVVLRTPALYCFLF